LAQHKGSTYGTLGRLVQPSQEQFENDLAGQLNSLHGQGRIWVEDESPTIGKRMIPRSFWKAMQGSILFDVQVVEEDRVKALVGEYGSLDPDFLVGCTERISKRLGTERTKKAVIAIREQRMEDFIREVLVYYDKTYRTGLQTRQGRVIPVPVQDGHAMKNARFVLEAADAFSVRTIT
jgi:tRNA 2-selenouridine synthase